MSDRLDLSSLSEGPVGALAPASQVMARGAQRRRRRTTALAAAAFVVVAGGASLAARADGDSDALQYAPAPTPTAAVTAEPTLEPTLEPTPAATVRPTVVSGGTGTRLLTSRDAATAAGGAWVAGPERDESFARLQPCPTSDVGGRSGSARSLSQGQRQVWSQVIDFGSPSILAGLRDSVAQCPSRPGDSDRAGARATFALEASPDDYVVVRTTERDCTDCTVNDGLVVAVQEGGLVSYVGLPASERSRVDRWADVARARLTAAAVPVPEAKLEQGGKVWGVYLAVSRGEIDAKVDAARADVERLGYHPSSGQIGCDQGAAEGLGLPSEDYSMAAVYFETRELAQQFVDAYEPGVVGIALVTVFCAD